MNVHTPSNPKLSRIAVFLFSLSAVVLLVSGIVQLAGEGTTSEPSHVAGYAFSALPMLVVGALACAMVTPETYQRWMGLFLLLALVWVAAGLWSLLSMGAEGTLTGIAHLAVGVCGLFCVTLVRAVARQRGLTI